MFILDKKSFMYNKQFPKNIPVCKIVILQAVFV